jgi:translation initiation factor IF-2
VRDNFKSRGSLVSRHTGTDMINSHSKASPLRMKLDATNGKKSRTKLEKKDTADVYIPTTVSVGTLARLLNVRLGMWKFTLTVVGLNIPQ